MPPKKDKKKKPAPKKKEKKTQTQKQSQKTQKQSQKQTVIVNVGGRSKARPKPAPVLPPTIIRMNAPPLPLPFQQIQPLMEPVRPIAAPSILEKPTTASTEMQTNMSFREPVKKPVKKLLSDTEDDSDFIRRQELLRANRERMMEQRNRAEERRRERDAILLPADFLEKPFDVFEVESPPQPPTRRGRKKGSKNKPKDASV